jgi:hypothetical protein
VKLRKAEGLVIATVVVEKGEDRLVGEFLSPTGKGRTETLRHC